MAEERDDVEVAWERLVADFDREVDGPVVPWPAAEDFTDEADAAPSDEAEEAGDRPAGGTDPAGPPEPPTFKAFGSATAYAELGRPPETARTPDADDHYVPPPPPPLQRPDLPSGVAWAGLLGGPLLLLLSTVLDWTMPRLLTAACVVGFIGGLVYLIARLDDGSRRDGWDDGAQV